MLDDLRSYLSMASGLTEATTAKARDVITGLISTGLSLSTKAMPAPDMMGQVQDLADDLVATSKNNRDLLTAMIRSEVDKAVGRMGFVREEELAALRKHVQRLERQLEALEAAWTDSATEAAPDASAADAAPRAAEAPDAPEEPAAADEGDPEPTAAKAPGDEAPAPVKKKKKKILIDPEASA